MRNSCAKDYVRKKLEIFIYNHQGLLEGTDLNKFTFAEKCCSMKNDAECWVEYLQLTKSEKLENLGIVMSKARANLSGPELEKLHQIWTQ